MQNLDQQLFLALNFDGGPVWDRIMLTLSGTTMWIPLYAVILWLVWRRSGWRGMLLFLVLMAAAVALADMVAGIFKHNGLLGGLLPDFEPRWRQFIISPIEQHSKKPDDARDKILALMGDLPRVELFARQKTPGWDVWGNEIASDITLSERS